jgi:hypothetical protein
MKNGHERSEEEKRGTRRREGGRERAYPSFIVLGKRRDSLVI